MSFLVNKKYLFFILIYFSQGMALAFFRNFQKNYLIDQGLSLSKAGLFSSLLLIPFMLKFIWGYLSDRKELFSWGNRKPYIVFGLSLSFLGFLGASFYTPSESIYLYFSFMFLVSLGVSLYDACTDAWAIEQSSYQEQGKIQSIMSGSRATAFISFSYFIGWGSEHFSFNLCFAIFALLYALPLLYCWKFQKLSESKAFLSSQKNPLALLDKSIIFFFVYTIVYCLALFSMDGVLMVYLKQSLQFNEQQIGVLSAVRGIGSVIGAFLLAYLYKKLSKRSTVGTGALIALTAFYAIFYLNPAPGYQTLIILSVLWGILFGLQETYYFTRAMEFTPLTSAGFIFAFYMAIGNLGNALAEAFSFRFIDSFNYQNFFWVGAALSLFCLPFHGSLKHIRIKNKENSP